MRRFKSIFVGSVVSVLMFTLMVPPVSAATMAELQLQLNALMAQIAALNNSSSQSTGGFTAGDIVVTTAAVRVRTSGSITGQLVGVQPTNASGKVQAGPVVAGGYTWYRVDFAAGADGWVAGSWLKKSATNTTKLDVNTFVKTSSGGDNKMEPGSEDASIVNIAVSPASYDRYANKVVLQFTPASDNKEDLPWVTFEELTLWANGWNIMSVDAGNFSNWRKVGNGYEITVFSGNEKISPNRSYNFVLAVSSDEDTPAGDRWTVTAPANGVVIWSQANGHMTNAAMMTAYPIEFIGSDEEDDAILYTDSLDMSVTTEGENGELGDFTLEFELTAIADDIYIKNSATLSAKDGGVLYRVDGPSSDKVSAAMTSSADTESGYYVINEGETEDFEVNVWVEATVAGTYRVALESIRYSFSPSVGTSNHVFTPSEDYRTPYASLQAAEVTPVTYAIDITAPAEGTTYKPGDSVNLTWKATNLNDQTAVVMLYGENSERRVLQNVPLGTGKAQFKIPVSDNYSTVVDGSYKLTLAVVGNKDGNPKNVTDSVGINIKSNAIPKPVPPTIKPTCVVTTDKATYKLGDSIKVSWTTKNAGYASFKKDTSGKDTLVLPGDKLGASGSQMVKANVLGNPVITMLAHSSTSKDLTGECSVKINIGDTTPAPAPYVTITKITEGQSPTISGNSEEKVTTLGLSIGGPSGDKVYGSGSITATNGKWSHKVTEKLPVGKNQVIVYVDNKEVARQSFVVSATPVADPALGTYLGYMNGKVFIETKNISEKDALANCKLNAKNNPTATVRCTWNGAEIYKNEPKPVTPTPTPITAAGKIDTFTASPTSAPSNTSITLSWKATGVKDCRLVSRSVSESGTGAEVVVNNSVSTTGSFQVKTSWMGTYKMNYTLRCADSTTNKAIEKTVVVSEKVVAVEPVKTPTPVCNSFTAAPRKITTAGTSTLTWKTTNANRVVLTRANGNVTEHDANGSVKVTPNKTGVFELAVHGNGGVAKCSVTVEVTKPVSVPVAPTAGQVQGASIDVYAQMASILEAARGILQIIESRQ